MGNGCGAGLGKLLKIKTVLKAFAIYYTHCATHVQTELEQPSGSLRQTRVKYSTAVA